MILYPQKIDIEDALTENVSIINEFIQAAKYDKTKNKVKMFNLLSPESQRNFINIHIKRFKLL